SQLLLVNRIEESAAHGAATENALPLSSTVVGGHCLDCSGLKKERVFIGQIMHGDGKADDGFTVDGDYSAAVAGNCVQFRVFSFEFRVIFGTQTGSLRYIAW